MNIWKLAMMTSSCIWFQATLLSVIISSMIPASLRNRSFQRLSPNCIASRGRDKPIENHSGALFLADDREAEVVIVAAGTVGGPTIVVHAHLDSLGFGSAVNEINALPELAPLACVFLSHSQFSSCRYRFNSFAS